MKFITFRLFGDYAHFKRYYTTTSPLTFDFPPRTVIAGLIGAILGFSKVRGAEDACLKYFSKKEAMIGVRLNSGIEKRIIPVNYLKTSEKKGFRGMGPRKQIRLELIYQPDYTIYFSHTDPGLYNKLKKYLSEKLAVYTPYLGSSEYLAGIEFIKESRDVESMASTELMPVHSVLNCSGIKDIEFEAGKEYMKANVPAEMNEDRVVTAYLEMLYERKGQAILCIPGKYYKIGKENIMLL